MNCVRCLSEIAPGAKFCGNCGLLVAQPSPAETGEHEPTYLHDRIMLEVVAGPGVGKRYPLGSVARLGRANGNEIQLFDAEVSRLHAVIYRYDEGFAIVDQNSVNGTFLNGRKISEPAWINPGDKISLGRTQIMVAGPGVNGQAGQPSQAAAQVEEPGGGSTTWIIIGVMGAVGVFLMLVLAAIAYFLFF